MENGVIKSFEQQLKEFKLLFITAPNEQIDDTLKERIKEWSDVPKAIEILQALDYASMYSLGSEFAISVMDVAFKLAVENEQADMTTLLQQAWWRD